MFVDKKLIQVVLPFIGTTLLICGYIKLSIFYGYFNIEIYNYLEFTEILTLFMPDIIKNIMIISIAFFLVYLFVGNNHFERNAALHNTILESDSFWKRFKLLFKLNPTLAWLSFFTIIASIVMAIWFPERVANYILSSAIFPAIFFFNIIDFEYKRKYKAFNDEKLNPSYSNLAFVIFLFLIYTITSSYREIRAVQKTNKIVEFTYQDKSVKSNNQKCYLGQTKNYLFMKNFEKKEVYIFERRLISDFKMKNSSKKN